MNNTPETPAQNINPAVIVEADVQNYENPKKRLKLLIIAVVVIIIGFVGIFRLITGTWLGAKAEGSHSYNPYFADCEPVIENRPVLRQGPQSDSEDASNGPCVQVLQRALNDCCSQTLTEDGWLGPVTGKAVKNFQRFYGLTVDGIVGPKTWSHLDYLSAIAGRVYFATPDDPFLTPQEVWDRARAEEAASETSTEDADSSESEDEGSIGEDEVSEDTSVETGGDTSIPEESTDETPEDTPIPTPVPTEPEPYEADPENCITTPDLSTGINDNDCVAKVQEIVDAPIDGDYGSVTELAVSWYAEDRCLAGSENGKKWLATYWGGESSCTDEDLDWIEEDSSEEIGSEDGEQDDTSEDEEFFEDSELTEETFEEDSSEEIGSEDGEQDDTSLDEATTSSSYELSAKETLAKIKCGLTSNAKYSYVYYKRPRYVCTELNKTSDTLSNVAFCDLQHRTTQGKLTTTLNGSCTSRRTTFTPATSLSSIYNQESKGKQ